MPAEGPSAAQQADEALGSQTTEQEQRAAQAATSDERALAPAATAQVGPSASSRQSAVLRWATAGLASCLSGCPAVLLAQHWACSGSQAQRGMT